MNDRVEDPRVAKEYLLWSVLPRDGWYAVTLDLNDRFAQNLAVVRMLLIFLLVLLFYCD